MSKTKILIVDDEPLFLKALETTLKRNNYQVVCAGDGETAIKKAHEEKPDLIILDIIMSGVNGMVVLGRLREDEETMHTPVIMLTALQDREVIADTIEGGAVDYITKPFEEHELLKRIRNALNEVS